MVRRRQDQDTEQSIQKSDELTKTRPKGDNTSMRHEYPILKQERNGYYYIYFDRHTRESLQTKDNREALPVFNIKKQEYLNKLHEKILFLAKKKGDYTLDEYAGIYMKAARNWKRAETLRIDEYVLGRLRNFEYVIPGTETQVRVGSLVIDQVKRSLLIVDAFHAEVLKTASKASLNVYIRHLKSIFRYGVDHELLVRNPYEKVRQVRIQREPVRVLMDREIGKILAVQERPRAEGRAGFRPDKEFLLMIEAYLHTGCRCAELVNLQREDLKKDHIVIRNTKTGQFRIVDLTQQAVAIFARIPKRKRMRLFPRWHPQTVSHMFLEYAREAGIKDVNLHDLRHTFASRCLEAGMSLATVQVLLGHESIDTTIRYYGHMSREHIKQEILKLKYGYSTQQGTQQGIVINGNN